MCSIYDVGLLRDQYLLQLESFRTNLFILSPPALELCRSLLAGDEPEEFLHRVPRGLLTGVDQLTLHPCTKGRFFDAMTNKLDQLQRGRSNEVTTVDFAEITEKVLLQAE